MDFFSTRSISLSHLLRVFANDSDVDFVAEAQLRERKKRTHSQLSSSLQMREGEEKISTANNQMDLDEKRKEKTSVTQHMTIWESEKLLCIQTSYTENGFEKFEVQGNQIVSGHRSLLDIALSSLCHQENDDDGRLSHSIPSHPLKCVQCTLDH